MALRRSLTALGAAGLEGMAVVSAIGGGWGLAPALPGGPCAAAAGLPPSLLGGPASWGFAPVFPGAFFLPVLGGRGPGGPRGSPREASAGGRGAAR